MKPTLLLVTSACLGSGLVAQSMTSPVGFELVEGNSAAPTFFGAIDRRFQQVDGTPIGGGPRSFTSMSFRRDGDRATPTATNRTVDVTVLMGHGDTVTAGSTFASNYLGAPTTVFATQQVSLPDWSASIPGPAPFDFTITFDVPFPYNGVDALVTEIIIENSSNFGTVWTDRHVDAFVFAESTQTHPGCTAGGQVVPFTNSVVSFNFGPSQSLGQRLIIAAGGAPSAAPVAIDFCLPTPPIPFPGLCADFAADVIVSLPMGESSPTGFAPDVTLDIPYNPLLDNLTFTTQALSIDPTQPGLPVVVSDVQSLTLPPPAPPLDCLYVYGPPTSSIGTLFPRRGLVLEFN